jgi:hypothetical protein
VPAAEFGPGAGDGELFEVPERPESAGDRKNRERRDPAADGWESEVAHDAIRPVLEAFLAEWTAPAGGRAQLEPFLAQAFEGASELRPAALETVFDDGCTRVRRPAGGSELGQPWRAPDELPEVLSGALAPFAGSSAIEALVQIAAIEGAGESWEIEALLEVHGQVEQRRVQQNASWRMGWDVPAAGQPRMRWIRLVSYQEAEGPGFLAEHTRYLFADHPFWDREFRLGVGDYYFRQDKLTGNAFIGGQGIAVGDLDGDGLDDVYVCQQGGLPNRLFLHQEDGTAVNASNKLGLDVLDNTRGALIVDLDGDARQDLALAVRQDVVVFFNEGPGAKFTPVGLRGRGTEDVFSITAADPDLDGDLDLYACRYVKDGLMSGVPVPYHDADNGATNFFWRNLGKREFSEDSAAAGLMQNNSKFSLASIWEDFDQDGRIDLYVSNDFGRKNLYMNGAEGRFRDQATERGAEDMAAGMGVSVADVDHDGWPDILSTNMFSAEGLRIASLPERFMGGSHPEVHAHYVRHARGNTLLRNRGDGTFEDLTETAGMARAGWGWGALFVDLNNDGWEDIYAPNGFITNHDRADVSSFFWRRVVGQSPPVAGEAPKNYRNAWSSIQHMVMGSGDSWAGNERDNVFLSLGGARFADVSYASAADYPDDSRAVAAVDWDDDGRLDLMLKNRTAPRLRFLRNTGPAAHYLKLDLRGTQCNRDAIGATALVDVGGTVLRKTVYAGDGYLSQSQKRLHFGLGQSTEVRSVSVRWPGGAEERFSGLAADQRYLLVQGSGRAEPVAARPHAVFAALEPVIETRREAPTHRAPLVDRLPMGPVAIPAFDDPARAIQEFAGRPLLITLWESTSDASQAQLRAFHEQADELAASQLALVPLTLDEGPALARARETLRGLGLETGAGYVDRALSKTLEVVFVEVFGRLEAPLPASLLFDPTGQLAVIYRGLVDVDQLVLDAGRVARGEGGNSDMLFGGGLWYSRGQRDFATLSKVFAELGRAPLAELYASLAE